tara:strand:- start:961 stop:2793 length:1833 start_codon:yes stop_codon:yes gene_type:complete
MLTKSLDVARYVKASAGRASLNVVFEDQGCPRHDGRTIYLPKITRHTTLEQMQEIMSSTDHEVAHDLYSDFTILHEKKLDTSSSTLGILWNILEDSRVNALEAREYEGFRELWDLSTPRLLKSINRKTNGKSEFDVLLRSLIKWDTGASAALFPSCELAGKEFVTDNKLDLILERFTPRLLACQNEIEKKAGSKMTYDLAVDILKALGGKPPEPEKKKKATDEEGEVGEKKGEKGEPTEDKLKGIDTKKETSDDPEEDAPPTPPGDDEWSIARVKITDVEDKLVSTHEAREDARMSKVGLLYTVSFSGKPDSWKATPPDEFAVVNYPRHTARPSLVSLLATDTKAVSFFKDSFELRVRSKSVSVDNFAQQVRRLIQIRSKVKYEYGVKKGKLDYPRLSRLALKLPGFSERIFKNKITNSTLDAAVTVLIDMSGSMSGDKVLFACEAALLLNSVFSILNVPLEILGFTDTANSSCADTLMYVYKEFSTLHTSEDKLMDYIAASSTKMVGNPDGDCILWSYDRLLKRKEKKRLLIVMSDGQPAASRHGHDLADYTLKVIQEIEKLKRVEIYGLGLCDESVKRFYKHHSTVSKPEDIPFKLLELIERKLLNDY